MHHIQVQTKGWFFTIGIGISLLLILGCLCPVQGIIVSIQPLEIVEGDLVTVHVQDLPNGTRFSFGLEGNFHGSPGEIFTFRASSLTMPFSLQEGAVSVYSEHTHWTRLTVQKGNQTAGMKGDSVDGIFQTSQSQNISAGTIDDLVVDGQILPDQSTVFFRVILSGIKYGPTSSQISFLVRGVEKGTVTILAEADGAEILRQGVILRASATPTNSPGPSSGSTGIVSVVPMETTPTTSPPLEEQEIVSSSLDGRVWLEGGQNCSIVDRGPEEFPSEWKMVSPAYSVGSENLTFSSSATLVFHLSGIVRDTPLFLAKWEEKEWRMLPSRIEGETIRAEIAAAGIYGLFTTEDSLSDARTIAGEMPNSEYHPIAGTQSPLSLSYVLAGIIGGILLIRRRV